jgi:hypothetical protein
MVEGKVMAKNICADLVNKRAVSFVNYKTKVKSTTG